MCGIDVIYTKQTWKEMKNLNCDYILNKILILFFKKEDIPMHKKIA